MGAQQEHSLLVGELKPKSVNMLETRKGYVKESCIHKKR